MFGRGCDIDCVIAARGATASGKEDDDLATKRAVEAGAIIFFGGDVLVGGLDSDHASVDATASAAIAAVLLDGVDEEGPDGMGPTFLI
jgi:hypothetical protein